MDIPLGALAIEVMASGNLSLKSYRAHCLGAFPVYARAIEAFWVAKSGNEPMQSINSLDLLTQRAQLLALLQ